MFPEAPPHQMITVRNAGDYDKPMTKAELRGPTTPSKARKVKTKAARTSNRKGRRPWYGPGYRPA